ncbi:MAG: hypothetical protein H0X35_11465 [Pseudonocardiales bacterium]|nr:hypothetical protein [Pseudonocardiales bacterium]
MPQRITTTTHQWVAAACIPVDPKAAKRAVDRQSVRAYMLDQDLKIPILDVYCENCRRPWEDVADIKRCEAAESNEHLRGGPIGERTKRRHSYHNCFDEGCPPDEVAEA